MINHWLQKRNINPLCLPVWDFQEWIGDFIKEKYKGCYVKVVEVTNLINRKQIKQF